MSIAMDNTIVGYHGTKALKKILKEGINLGTDSAGNYEQPVVFLTSDIEEAKKYARLAKRAYPDSDAGVVKVVIPPKGNFVSDFTDYIKGWGHYENDERILPDHPPEGESWVVLGGRIPAKYLSPVKVALERSKR